MDNAYIEEIDVGNVVGSVATFNGRKGEVVPETGDYNLEKIGCSIITNQDINDLWDNN